MAGKRPGPPPKNPEELVRRNVDPIVGADGWTDIDPAPNDGEIPPIPAWCDAGEAARAIYEDLARLPQARLWGPGTWLQLHMSLPLFDRYMSRPGSEGLKALVATWGTGLRLTEDDLQRARVRVRKLIESEDESTPTRKANGVASLDDRRRRLMGA